MYVEKGLLITNLNLLKLGKLKNGVILRRSVKSNSTIILLGVRRSIKIDRRFYGLWRTYEMYCRIFDFHLPNTKENPCLDTHILITPCKIQDKIRLTFHHLQSIILTQCGVRRDRQKLLNITLNLKYESVMFYKLEDFATDVKIEGYEQSKDIFKQVEELFRTNTYLGSCVASTRWCLSLSAIAYASHAFLFLLVEKLSRRVRLIRCCSAYPDRMFPKPFQT